MPANVATAYVQIIPSAQGIGSGIAQALGGDAAATSAGESIGGKLVNTIKGVIAAAGIGAALGKALTEGAALEQSLGGVESMFKDSADQVIAAADNAYRTAGVSANDYMEQVTSFSATLLQGLGGDTEAAAKYADQAIVQMADNANKMGTDIASIQYAYQGFAKDNYTMLDNLKLGYGGTQSEMARLINDSGVLGDSIEVTAETVKDVPFDKIIEAIGVIQDELGITGTTAQEAATTLSGSFASMQAAAQNVLANLALGRDLGPALDGLAQTVVTFLTGNLLPAVWNILSALPGALATFVQELGSQLAAVLPQLTSGITAALPQLLQSGTEMVQNVAQGITEALPQAAQAALDMVGSFLTMVVENLPDVLDAGTKILSSVVQGIGGSLPQIVRAAGGMLAEFLTVILQNLPEIIASGFKLIVSLIQGIGNAVPGLLTAAADAARTIWDAITRLDWPQLGRDIISGLINGIGAMAGALWDAATNIAKTALDAIKGFFGIASPSRLMQFEIGPYIPQGLALGIEKNAGYVTDAMDSLGLQSTARLRSAISAGAPSAASASTQADSAVLSAINTAARAIVQAVQENGGDLVIGDDTIYRSYNRARQSQAIMTGGVV